MEFQKQVEFDWHIVHIILQNNCTGQFQNETFKM